MLFFCCLGPSKITLAPRISHLNLYGAHYSNVLHHFGTAALTIHTHLSSCHADIRERIKNPLQWQQSHCTYIIHFILIKLHNVGKLHGIHEK